MTTTKRTNPFKSSQNQRTNFPPLEGFFKDDEDGNHSFHSRSKTCPSDLLNFSVDMSIAGKAELAQHRYHVSKYGIDNSFLMPSSNDSSPDGTPFKRKERDEWDRLMDDSNPIDCSMISLSSTAVLDRSAVQLGTVAKRLSSINDNKRNAKVVVGIARTPSPEKSPDQSSDDDDDTLNDTSNRSSFFDRSMIQSLITPVKSRYKLASIQDQMMVNKQRGQECYESSSTEDEESPAKSETHGSTFEHMILRFNEDFDNDVDKTEDEDLSPSKNTSVVSFAADTSFRTGDTSLSLSKKKKRKKKRRNSLKSNNSSQDKKSFIKEALKGLDLLSTSAADPEQQQKIDEISNALKGLGILSSTSPIPKQQNLSHRSTSSPSSHGVSSLESPGLTPSPNNSDETSILKKKPSPTDLNNLLLSPIELDKSRLSEVPFDEDKGRRRGSSSVPFDESVYRQTIMKPLKHVDSQSSLMSTEFTGKRNLFQDEKNQESNTSMNKKKFDHCCTLSTVKSEESYLDDKADDFGDFVSIDNEPNKLSGESESPTPFKHKRRILVDVTNCSDGDTPSGGLEITLDEDFKEEERRGVRLCRLEKMKQLGLTHLLYTKPSRRVTEQIDADSSF